MDIVTAIIAFLVAIITFGQYRVAHDQIKNSLIERRYSVFKDIQNELSFIVRRGNINTETISKINDARQRSWFLFEDDITGYVDLIYDKLCDFEYCITSLADNLSLSTSEREELIRKKGEHFKWFYDQLPTLRERFDPYIGLKASLWWRDLLPWPRRKRLSKKLSG